MAFLTASVHWLGPIGRGGREAFFMFWETLWPLILGFALSGAVQSFVSRRTLQRTLGDHGPKAVGRATVFGMASSSCSYAATAMGKSLFAKGADFIATSVFMFASTNLVIELGIVLVVLMGWQFAVSEFVGGAIMIVLLVGLGSLWLRGRLVSQARDRLATESTSAETAAMDELQQQPWKRRLRSRAGWADAATYTMTDLKMIRKEILIGYVVAGFLATKVPSHVWNAVFLHGHGFWTSAENAVVGPFIAIISFVCSVGNVPLAAALWHGGISFGGVISFLFADLITFPLLLIYRRYYGTALTLRLLAVFWIVMSGAGLLTQGLFRLAGLVPTRHPSRIVPESITWNYTTVLNIVFLAAFAGLYWLYRHAGRFGGGDGLAIDPMCGMQVEKALAPATASHNGELIYFCSDGCAERYGLSLDRPLSVTS